MTFKKQFFLLTSIIVLIPLISMIYLAIHTYLRSPSRLIIKGTDEIGAKKGYFYNKKRQKDLEETLQLLPPDVESLIIRNDGLVVFTKMTGIAPGRYIRQHELWEMIQNSSDEYFYQFTHVQIGGRTHTLITRISRTKQPFDKKQPFILSVIVILFVTVTVCVILLAVIFRNISKSITTLEEKTNSIASGDLGVKIDTKQNARSRPNEIISIAESLETMRLSLIEAQNQKNKFIMGISHDLRTPVAVIKGYTEALSDGIISTPDEVQSTIGLIQEKTSQLESMIDTLINFMKLNISEIRQTLTPSSITQFILNFAKESEITGNIFKRHIVTDIHFEKDIQVPFDALLITRAFQNIFNNALRYTKENDTITITSYKTEDEILFSIKDTGCGIAEEDLNSIFELFYRASSSRREEGMGIGLAVVKNIVETHGWNISVKSQKNEGSEFIIKIPLKNTDEDKPEL